ncbi:MAG: class C sortase, partial [Lachnospiraceae bacterium]|nr:class C sortase [Lachnospiraceae bacterium]
PSPGYLLKGGISTKKKVITICIATLAFLIALGITLYPMISTWYNERHQAEVHIHYQEKVEQVDNTKLIEAKELAVAYNQTILPGAQDEDSFSNEALLNAIEDYAGLLNLAGDGIMGYVEIPKIGVSLPIYHGTNNSTLERGVGHLLGSSLPVGGESTHSVLTAHSGMASQKMFSDLDRMKIGDVFYLDVLGERLAYQVDQIKTVLPYDTTYLQTEIGSDLCTLVTCTPFGVNTHRLLVRGTRIPYEEAEVIVEEKLETEEPVKSTWEQQYLQGIIIGVSAVVILGLGIMVFCIVRRRRNG